MGELRELEISPFCGSTQGYGPVSRSGPVSAGGITLIYTECVQFFVTESGNIAYCNGFQGLLGGGY